MPECVELIIPVSMGNDIYKGDCDDDVEKAISDFCTQLRAKKKASFVVFGGSAATWQYGESKGPAYDANVRRCHAIFHAYGVHSVLGAKQLTRLKLVDGIGHVDVSCESTVFAAYKTWVDMALREYSFVPMARGEFQECESQLRDNSVLVDEPVEYEECLADDFWCGKPWLQVAKYVRVQQQFWLDDGWAVPSKLWRRMLEKAMRMHEFGSADCGGFDVLMEVLLGDGRAEKLKAVAMKPCEVCGAETNTSRKKWLRGDARRKDRRVFCRSCLMVEYEVEQEGGSISDMR